jgi:hypothetical protein
MRKQRGYKRTICCDLRVNDGGITFGVAEDCRKRRVSAARECSGRLLPPPPPAEKATARQDQAGKASTGDGAGNGGTSIKLRNNDVPPH